MPRNNGASSSAKTRRATARPFSRVEQWQNGKYYAVAKRAGMCSGPWDTAEQAASVVRAWNQATEA